MKKIYPLLLLCFLIGEVAIAQEKSIGKKGIKTTVFILNLGDPTQNAMLNSDSTKRLIVPTKNPLAFSLVNGNPYKYRYVLIVKL